MQVAEAEKFPFSEEDIVEILKGAYLGLTVGDLLNMNPEALEGVYAVAYNFYNVHDYEQAEKLFKYLCFLQSKNYKYLMGLAGCSQATKKYKEAIDLYAQAGIATTLKNPIPFYHAAQCFLKLGNIESAIDSLKALAIMGDENNVEHKKCKEKAEQLLIALEKVGKE